MDSTLKSDAVSSGNQTNNDQELSSRNSKKKNKRRSENRIDESGQKGSQLKDSQSTDLQITSNVVNCFSEDVDSSKKLKKELVEDEESEPETFERFQKFNLSQSKKNKSKRETSAEGSHSSTNTTERTDSSSQNTNPAIHFTLKAGKSCPKFPPGPCIKKPVHLGPPPASPGFKKPVSTVVEKQNSENRQSSKTEDRDNDKIHAASEPTPTLSGNDSQNVQKSSSRNRKRDKGEPAPAQSDSGSQNVSKLSSKDKTNKIHVTSKPASKQSDSGSQKLPKSCSKDHKNDETQVISELTRTQPNGDSQNIQKPPTKGRGQLVAKLSSYIAGPKLKGRGRALTSELLRHSDFAASVDSSQVQNSVPSPQKNRDLSAIDNRYSTEFENIPNLVHRVSEVPNDERPEAPIDRSKEPNHVEYKPNAGSRNEQEKKSDRITRKKLSRDYSERREQLSHDEKISSKSKHRSDDSNNQKLKEQRSRETSQQENPPFREHSHDRKNSPIVEYNENWATPVGISDQPQHMSNYWQYYAPQNGYPAMTLPITSSLDVPLSLPPGFEPSRPPPGFECSRPPPGFEHTCPPPMARCPPGFENQFVLPPQQPPEGFQSEDVQQCYVNDSENSHEEYNHRKRRSDPLGNKHQNDHRNNYEKSHYNENHAHQNSHRAKKPYKSPHRDPLRSNYGEMSRSNKNYDQRDDARYENDCRDSSKYNDENQQSSRRFEGPLPNRERNHSHKHSHENRHKNRENQSHHDRNRDQRGSQKYRNRNDSSRYHSYDENQQQNRSFKERIRTNDESNYHENSDHNRSQNHQHSAHYNKNKSHQSDSQRYRNQNDPSRNRSYEESTPENKINDRPYPVDNRSHDRENRKSNDHRKRQNEQNNEKRPSHHKNDGSRFSNADPKFSSNKSKSSSISECTCEILDDWETWNVEDTPQLCDYCQAQSTEETSNRSRSTKLKSNDKESSRPRSRSKRSASERDTERSPSPSGRKKKQNDSLEEDSFAIVPSRRPRDDHHFSHISKAQPKIKKIRNKQPLFVPKAEFYEPVIREIRADLFQASEEYSLAHCVAADLRMGAGIAVEFKKLFGGVRDLWDQDKGVGEVAVLQRGQRYIFYLITKELSNGKPTMNSITSAINSLRKSCDLYKVQKLAIPRIGCGLDRLDWNEIKDVLYEVFKDSGIEILVHVV